MSESKHMGRCRSEMTAAYRAKSFKPNDSDKVIADAIDRLAADVAAIKAKVEQIAPEDVRHFVESEKAWVKLVEEQRDAAVRERDEARALLELAQVQRTAAYADRDEARAEVYQLKCSRTETSKERDAAIRERDEARAEVERLKNELYDRVQEILSLRADTVERYEPHAAPQPAAPEPAYYLVTNERDRPVHVSRMHPGVGWWDGCTITALYVAPQPAAPPAGWLTDRERHVLSSLLSERPCDWSLHWADDIQPVFRSILSRAGSPPVVEVPLFENYAPEALHLRYRDAISRAGIQWKEVGRE